VELRQLRYFVVVAEELHFSRAAARIPLAQPALSQQIQKLEREVGTRLFDRDHRRVELTEAGRILLVHARATLATADRALAAVRAHADGLTGVLRVGVFDAGAAELTGPILQAFRAAHPSVEMTIRCLNYTQQVGLVVDGEVDVAIVRPPLGDDRLALSTLMVEPRVAMLPEHHPLADADELSIDAVLDEPFIAAHPASGERWRNYWLATDHRGGLTPNLAIDSIVTTSEMMAAIAFGGAVSTTAASIERSAPNWGVRYVPLTDVPGSPVAVATPVEGAAPLAEAFRKIAVRVSRQLIDLVPDARLPDDDED